MRHAVHIRISIHALLAESDPPLRWSLTPRRNFYPRSPCGERRLFQGPFSPKENFYPRSPCGERPKPRAACRDRAEFLSTLSLRRATDRILSPPPQIFDFYPRSPCGERRGGGLRHAVHIRISIHALLAESDRAGLPDV